jgi:hypothetical protein
MRQDRGLTRLDEIRRAVEALQQVLEGREGFQGCGRKRGASTLKRTDDANSTGQFFSGLGTRGRLAAWRSPRGWMKHALYR